MKATYESLILEYLEKHGSITSMEAIQLFGATRLSAIIYKLRRKYGCNIVSTLEKVNTRHGRKTVVSRYVLVKHGEDVTE